MSRGQRLAHLLDELTASVVHGADATCLIGQGGSVGVTR